MPCARRGRSGTGRPACSAFSFRSRRPPSAGSRPMRCLVLIGLLVTCPSDPSEATPDAPVDVDAALDASPDAATACRSRASASSRACAACSNDPELTGTTPSIVHVTLTFARHYVDPTDRPLLTEGGRSAGDAERGWQLGTVGGVRVRAARALRARDAAQDRDRDRLRHDRQDHRSRGRARRPQDRRQRHARGRVPVRLNRTRCRRRRR